MYVVHAKSPTVIPAKAGIQVRVPYWIPVFTGMTDKVCVIWIRVKLSPESCHVKIDSFFWYVII